MNDDQIIDTFCSLLPSQQSEVIRTAGAPRHHLPPETETAAKRGQALLDWAGQSPANRGDLVAALLLTQVRDGRARQSHQRIPPSDLALLFDRQSHEELVAETLREAAERPPRVLTFLLPGCPDESPLDFVERCARFTQPKARLQAHLPPVIADFSRIPLGWPALRLSHQKRMARLREDLARHIGVSDSGLDDAGLRAAVTDWMARERKHKVLHYQLFVTHIAARDGLLIRGLVEFWRHVELPPASCGLTLFICVHFRRFRLWRYFGSSAGCIRQVKKAFAGAADVVIMDHLKAPHRDDVDSWADSKCAEAWRFMDDARAAPEFREPPLQADELKLSARAAFGWGRRKPFLHLKPGLEEAIRKSHEKFLKHKGSG